jgi:hypothetical protein
MVWSCWKNESWIVAFAINRKKDKCKAWKEKAVEIGKDKSVKIQSEEDER